MDKSLDLKAEIKPYLKDNEEILWCQRPVKLFTPTLPDVAEMALGVIWIAFCVFWLVMGLLGEKTDLASRIFPYLAIPFSGIGFWFSLIKPIIKTVRRKSVLYAITNKRALVASTGRIEYVEEYCFKNVGDMQIRVNKDGSGTIYMFAEKMDDKKRYTTSGLFGIEGVEAVCQLLKERIEKRK